MALWMDDLDVFLATAGLSLEDIEFARDLYFEHLDDYSAVLNAWRSEPRLQAIGAVYGWGNLDSAERQSGH